ncbi:hypothetical protein C2S51_030911 [Perilla frutescens var. frutescens]|nr:hypothetical protein C2S51_030911 [Perilla frutescens var. frutescens]
MRSYRLFKESVGEYSNVGCTIGDFKNFSRDLKAYVVGVDAQMMLDKLFMKRELCSAFYFDYGVDKHDRLTRVFWADPIARKNFAIFGDVVSFDATYNTNRYKMIFAPFTGKDNHGKLVTFGASLLCGEDKEAYGWVLSKFKECMGQGPKMIITDQDPALSIAVERALVGTRHRLCMWHIMLKVPEKVPSHLRKDELFTERFNASVWTDLIEPLEFEQKWKDIIEDFDLTDEIWFKSMYDLRKYWIPAYFRDFSMSGLCRTTSTSESVNNFYSGYLDKNSNLLAFFMQFESALKSQRHANEQLNSADESRLPQLSTPLLLEKHAATIYTTQIFLKVQKQIEAACYDCVVDKIHDHESTRNYCVNDCEKGVFNVMLNKVDSYVACSCKKFVRDGLLCSHAFLILKDLKLSAIPDMYVVSRWTKSARLNPIHDLPGGIEEQLVVIDENKLVMNQLISEFYQCVGYVDGNKERMCQLLSGIRQLKESFASGEDYSSSIAKKKLLFDQYYGTPTPTEVFVLPPNQVKTKGSGSGLKTRQEKKVERESKPLRKCSKSNGDQLDTYQVYAFKEFELAEIRAATNSFSTELIVSESGEKSHNIVYRVKLRSNCLVAIKRFSKQSWPDSKQFMLSFSSSCG